VGTYDLLIQFFRILDFSTLTLEFDPDAAPLSPERRAAADDALARTLEALLPLLAATGDGAPVHVERRRPLPDEAEGEGGLNGYGLGELGLLVREQPLEWIVTLPEEPVEDDPAAAGGPPDDFDPEDRLAWARFIAFSSRWGGRVVLLAVRREGGSFVPDSRASTSELSSWESDAAAALERFLRPIED
jgi:hypothetical protein